MKKSNPLVGLFIFLLIIISLIIGGYFLINFVILPQIVIPQIEKQVKLALGQELEIKHLGISPQGIIQIRQATLNHKQDNTVFVQAQLITLKPSYKQIFNSWKKNKNQFDIPLRVNLGQAQINQAPIIINLDASADVLINLDLKNPENLNYNAELNLNPMRISQVPVLGEIKDIKGNIHIFKNSVSSSDINGTINDAIAKLNFSVEDYANPKIELACELSPLLLNLKCELKDDTLTISELNAAYNQISLNVSGQINTVKENPMAQINSRLSMQLEDLAQLPLEIKEILKTFKPTGLIKADLQIQGPLKNIPQLGGTISLSSAKISILDYILNDLKFQAAIENGQINLTKFAVNFLDIAIKTTGSLNLMSKTLDYNCRINIENLELLNLKTLLAQQAKFNSNLTGLINAHILLKGQALDLNLIALELSANLKNLVYEQMILPELIEFDTDLSIKNLSNIILRKATVNDLVTQLTVNGNIANIILDPQADLTGQINTKLDKLNSYPMLKLPAAVKLRGNPKIDFKLNGKLKKPDELDLGFTLSTEAVQYNQFNLESLNAQGAYKAKQLTLSSLLAELYKGQLKAAADADLKDPLKPKFNLTANLDQLDIQTFARLTGLIQPDFQGMLNARIKISGSGAKPENLDVKSNLNLELINAVVNNIPIEKANVQLNADYQNDSIQIKDSSLVYKDIQAQAKGTVSSLSNNPRVNLNLNTQLNIDDLNKLPIPQTVKKQLDDLGLKGSVSAKINLNTLISNLTAMTLTANISSDQIEVKKIILQAINLTADMSNKILNAAASLKAYEGSADLTAKANFNSLDNFSYTAKANINKLNFGQLIKESQIIAQQHKGIVSLSADLEGKGTDLKTITGKANLKLNDALIVAMPLLKSIASIFSADFLVNFEITEGKADIIFEQEKATLQNTSFNGPQARILARGAILLGTLGFENFWTTLQLTESGAQKINPGLRNVFDFDGTVYQKDIEVKGTLSAPVIDQKKLLFGLGANALLNSVLKNPNEPAQQSSPQDMKIELFKGMLKGILK